MTKENLISFLCRTDLVSRKGGEEIAGYFEAKSIPKNEHLLQEGKVNDIYLFLEEGYMRAYTYDTDGDDITTNFYASNQVVFEVASFFNRTPSRENIVALTDCHGWVISFAQLNMLFHSIPEFREFGRSILVRGFVALKQRMLSMLNETAEERYNYLLQRQPEIFQHVPLKHIATYLGVTDTSLSRIRKEAAKK